MRERRGKGGNGMRWVLRGGTTTAREPWGEGRCEVLGDGPQRVCMTKEKRRREVGYKGGVSLT